ncbi:beta-N-acetylglucosaminidase domain-containing protein [Paenibacillus dokdonensis]|uniref:Beta-N-acetylglucosaminidase domain-containing protein n=1 Tax=Paenibacillus dokdonensis TaxID=2567944 RepID=A0ABU6GRY5_9BACL|nr:beta-N-acetylglucosaminidase domain-containing protein [Paenibacillus dokdonensis]MEC0242510.1 beta-N-acetylglucosaminidase domain-containing protein [Paenibacillus dokdonensis]
MQNTNQDPHYLYELYPVPQKVTSLSGESRLSDTIHIVVKSELKAATLPKLQKELHDLGLSSTVSSQFQEGQSNIVLALSGQGDTLPDLVADVDLLCNHKEGYNLLVRGNTSGAQVVITGYDNDGIHYGVVTLSQMLKQSPSGILKSCQIEDYPEILYRGYVEGFYGYPWSHEDRMDLMAFGGEQKLNTYIYAPKDDPYHRKHWRDLYPEDKAKDIAELAAAGHANNLNFVWTIHPGDSIDLSIEEDFLSVLNKLEQLYGLGVRQFGLLFDDLVGVPNGGQQAAFINRIDSEFVKAKGDVRPLITVGTRYCEAWGPSMTDYFKPFVETLHEDVEIMWTGAATMSNISKEQYDSPIQQIGSDRNLSVWWNYPVNDYCDSKILMGKIENLSSDLDNVNGFFSNPMNQAQASKQALFCIADHNWNTDAFDTNTSFSASFKAIAPEVAEDLEIFASNSSYLKDDGGVSGDFLFDESWYLKEDVKEFNAAIEAGQDASASAAGLRAHFERMELAANRIEEQCMNRNLVEELKPFLAAFKLMAQSGQNVIQAWNALRAGNLLDMEKHNEEAQKQLAAMENCKVNRLKEEIPFDFTVDVGTHVIKPLIAELIVKIAVNAGTEAEAPQLNYDRKNIALSSLGVTAEASSSVNDNENAAKTIDGSISSGKWCATEHRPYLTVDLKELKNIKQYRIINCGHPEARESKYWNTMHAQILASQDGEQFEIIDEIVDNREDVINRILAEGVTARYVRLQIIEPAQTSVDGSGHTRIYGFELFDELYPELSEKVWTSDMEYDPSGTLKIHHVRKGDCISLYESLDAETPFAVYGISADEGQDIVFNDISMYNIGNRVFVERKSGALLPSVRTSKGIA